MKITQLDQLKKFTAISADTGDFEVIKRFAVQDATTNPSLILKTVQKNYHKHFIQEIISKYATYNINDVMNRLLIVIGTKILEIIPGRVSTEVDARFSFDTESIVIYGRTIIKLYEACGIKRERILIKIAATWEGIKAAQILEQEGINCNMTLIFTLIQAIACANAGVKLISPFIGRIYDWHKKFDNTQKDISINPGVELVKKIYFYYRKFEINTQIMGASFRNLTQILELVGCDLLTISPEFLEELQKSHAPIKHKLYINEKDMLAIKKIHINEKYFRFTFNENAMATEKLAEGIRLFCNDTIKLEKLINQMRH